MTRFVLLVLAASVLPAADWPVYHGGSANTKFSTLKQINTRNVARLKQVWRFDSGDEFPGSEIQCNPIIAGGVMYASTPRLRIVALDAATGKQRWSFDPSDGRKTNRKHRNRGLILARGRIYFGFENWLYALDASTGKLAASFGSNGRIDLREGLGRDPVGLPVSNTTPGVVYKDMLILGGLTGEDLPSAPGDIRAYDLDSGTLRWSFHTIPHPGEFGYETWPKDAWKYAGGANSWAGLTLDEKRGIVFVPTGSAAFDFYGANRVGDNLFANSLLALDAATGKRIWHYQIVRHDVWDRDLPTAPTLITVRRDGKTIDAVAQITKSGHVWVFERETGKPMFPVEERAVPPSDVEGERLAAKQVLPLAPPPFARQRIPDGLAQSRNVRSGDQFVPPSKQGTVVYPGFDGGGEWGGGSWDPETRLFYVNGNEMAWVLRLVPRPRGRAVARASELYARHCASCHGRERQGSPPEFPSLIGLRTQQADVVRLISSGGGRMPSYGHLGEEAVRALALFVREGKDEVARANDSPMPGLEYYHDGYNKMLDVEGYPAIPPPWGTLTAYDLDKGRIRWQQPFGEYPDLAAKGRKDTGSENYGGAVVTAGGLLFIGATNFDKKFRAFDKRTGKLLWEASLPASGNATPATYEVNGKQYVVIAAGGGKGDPKKGAAPGGSYVAFALP